MWAKRTLNMDAILAGRWAIEGLPSRVHECSLEGAKPADLTVAFVVMTSWMKSAREIVCPSPRSASSRRLSSFNLQILLRRVERGMP